MNNRNLYTKISKMKIEKIEDWRFSRCIPYSKFKFESGQGRRHFFHWKILFLKSTTKIDPGFMRDKNPTIFFDILDYPKNTQYKGYCHQALTRGTQAKLLEAQVPYTA